MQKYKIENMQTSAITFRFSCFRNANVCKIYIFTYSLTFLYRNNTKQTFGQPNKKHKHIYLTIKQLQIHKHIKNSYI